MELRELIPGPLPSSHPIEDWFPLVRVDVRSLVFVHAMAWAAFETADEESLFDAEVVLGVFVSCVGVA